MMAMLLKNAQILTNLYPHTHTLAFNIYYPTKRRVKRKNDFIKINVTS